MDWSLDDRLIVLVILRILAGFLVLGGLGVFFFVRPLVADVENVAVRTHANGDGVAGGILLIDLVEFELVTINRLDLFAVEQAIDRLADGLGEIALIDDLALAKNLVVIAQNHLNI